MRQSTAKCYGTAAPMAKLHRCEPRISETVGYVCPCELDINPETYISTLSFWVEGPLPLTHSSF